MTDKQPTDLLFDYLIDDVYNLIKHLRDVYDIGFEDIIEVLSDKEYT